MTDTQPRRKRRPSFKKQVARLQSFIKHNRFDPLLVHKVDWLLLILVLAISFYGVVCIFAATGVPTEQTATSFLELLSIQPVSYARLQLLWIAVGLIAMCATMYFSYQLLSQFSNFIYWANIALLVIVLGMEAGRGGMSGWFRIGESRTFQPSEIAKLAIIISLAKWFSNRKKPIETFSEMLPVLAYVGLPLLLIVAQPDYGTAMVYIAILAVMLFISGTSYKLIGSILITFLLVLLPLWYYLMNADVSDNFRMMRILSFIDPSADPDAARQVSNAKIAIGSAGLWGKGLFQEGSFALLNYIPDDYTDFIFSIVAETFGFVGAGALVLGYFLLMLRMTALSSQSGDSFGSYLTIGIMAMMLFHIFENICMVIGLMPVTGIPLPFISYGGSNMLANYVGIGIVLNVYMRRSDVRQNTAAVKPTIEI
ncbi:MAG: rod shape-determining protein RodA [Clostridia bacterium]|nr:rod shape-determining protein RodA [Clostridia bacterium]